MNNALVETVEGPFYLLFRTIVGAYFLYWGLNGFFQWKAIPPNSSAFESFIGRLLQVPLLMTLVKGIEITAGLMLILGFWPELAWLALLPIVLVITTSHVLLNFRLGWRVALEVAVPYLILLGAYILQGPGR